MNRIITIGSGDSTVTLEVTGQQGQGSQRPGDTKLRVHVVSRGFSGTATTWVAADDLREFAEQLRAVERQRRGEATLASMSPEEFRLQLKSINSRGHFAVIGKLSHREYLGEGGPYTHSVTFGFEVDPTTLPALLASFEAIP